MLLSSRGRLSIRPCHRLDGAKTFSRGLGLVREF
jgi:hypothetical protein